MKLGRGRTIGPRSGTPTAVCGNTLIGLPPCAKGGGGGYCYWMKTCSSQMRLDNPQKRTVAAEAMYRLESKRALEHGRELSDDDPIFESEEFLKLMQDIMEGNDL